MAECVTCGGNLNEDGYCTACYKGLPLFPGSYSVPKPEVIEDKGENKSEK